MDDMVKVGGARMPVGEVHAYAANYLSGNGEWAYPAYDAYEGTEGPEIGDADLLVVSLLNAGQRALPTYYGLKKLVPSMNEILAKPELEGTFADANAATLSAIADLFGIIDKYPTPQVQKTKLMKVLHRKRPQLIPLFDENIRRCYSEIGDAPVPPIKERTHREFGVAWLPELQKDLREQLPVWNHIVGMAKIVPITPLRAIDIVGWRMGRKSAQSVAVS